MTYCAMMLLLFLLSPDAIRRPGSIPHFGLTVCGGHHRPSMALKLPKAPQPSVNRFLTLNAVTEW
jgi:hypothetical protein